MMKFADEAQAQAFVESELAPYCHSLVRQPVIDWDLRPDLRVVLRCLPEFPFHIEIKTCDHGARGGHASSLCSAVRQAASYADILRTPVFVAPLEATQKTELDWMKHPLGSALLLAGQFNVGAFYFGLHRFRNVRVVGIVLAGVQLVSLRHDETIVHSNALHLLTYKERLGSLAIRQSQNPSCSASVKRPISQSSPLGRGTPP